MRKEEEVWRKINEEIEGIEEEIRVLRREIGLKEDVIKELRIL